MSQFCENCIPAIDVTPDSVSVVDVPTAFDLPQPDQYAPDLTAQEVAIITVGLLALAGLTVSAATLQTNAAQYACLPQDLQIAALLYQLNQILINMPQSGVAGAGFVYTGDYGGMPPTIIPDSEGAIGIDDVTLRQWQYTIATGWM